MNSNCYDSWTSLVENFTICFILFFSILEGDRCLIMGRRDIMLHRCRISSIGALMDRGRIPSDLCG